MLIMFIKVIPCGFEYLYIINKLCVRVYSIHAYVCVKIILDNNNIFISAYHYSKGTQNIIFVMHASLIVRDLCK